MEYNHFYQQSILPRGKFWRRKAAQIAWSKFQKTVLTFDQQVYFKWYPIGGLDCCYSAVDKYVKDDEGGDVAMLFDLTVSIPKENVLTSK
jgi:hypothetical protein